MARQRFRLRAPYVFAEMASRIEIIAAKGGSKQVNPGNWILDGSDGKIVMTDEEFQKTYEPAPTESVQVQAGPSPLPSGGR